MTKPRRSPNRAIIAATAAGALLIGGAVVAFAAQPAAPLLSGPTGFINTATPVFGIADADGAVNVDGAGTFLYDFDGAPSIPLAAPGNVSPASPLGQGPRTLQVLEVGGADPDSPVAIAPFFVDTVAPSLSIGGAGTGAPTGNNGWFNTAATVTYTCTDPGGSNASAFAVGACPENVTSDGSFVLPARQVSDRAGNPSNTVLGLTFKRDTADPAKPVLASPDSISSVLNPTFTWTKVEDLNPSSANQISDMANYRLRIRTGSGTGTIVHEFTVAQPPGGPGGQISFSTVPNLLNNTNYFWTVEAFDAAGNGRLSDVGEFRVDITAPADPVFSAGPTNGAATNDSTPTFTFTGVPAATFTWETRNSLDELVPGVGFAGTGALGTVTLPTLPDGTYTFKAKQKAPNNKESGFASALFTVDTTAPAAPNITSSPGTTTNSQPSFGWSAAEQDGTFVWEVTGVGGIRVQGPGEAAAAAVSLPTSLVAGNYAFRVRQRDRAGNLSDWSAGEPFTIVNPQDPGPGPGTGGGTSGFRPSTRNAKALLPKVGVKVRPTATTLRWKKTRGATLYNLQVFRIDGTTYRKVHSAFPRGLKYKVPKKVLKSGKRYVWRVWPYLGAKKKYTPAPFGISWFDAK